MSKPSATLQRAVPMPYRGRGMWRGLRWAVNNTWHGRTQPANAQRDSETKNLGRYSGGLGATPRVIANGGQFASSFGGASNLVWTDFVKIAVPQTGVYYWLDTGGMSLACTMQFNRVLPAGNRRILTKRFGTAANFHGGALSFNQVAGNKFEFSYCDGVTTQSIYSTLVPVPGVTYNLVGRHWGNNPLSRAELWVNGKLEAVNAAPATYPLYHSDPPISFFGDTGSGDPTMDGWASMGGLWARPLTTTEIQALNVNPYAPWGPPAGPEGLPFAAGAGGIGCNCCPGWLSNWFDM